MNDQLKDNIKNQSQNQEGAENTKQSPISMPKGGGAVTGITEKFQANPLTGTASLSVPLNISPGRGEFTPQLALSYDSGSGNSPFGMGWNVGIGQITRKTQKELPRYNDTQDSDTFIIAGMEDLVPMIEYENGKPQKKVKEIWQYNENNEAIVLLEKIYYYAPRKEEAFSKIERYVNQSTGETYWKTTSKDNITNIYGFTADARIADSENPNKVFKWLIEKSLDNKGNIILYKYKKENKDEIQPTVSEKNRLESNLAFENKYLKKIKYGNKTPDSEDDFLFHIVFNYGEHDVANPTYEETENWSVRKDAFSVYNAGFEIRTYRLCQQVLMFHKFDELNSEKPILVKSTELNFNETPVATQIKSVEYKFYNGDETAIMPPFEFKYTESKIDTRLHSLELEQLAQLPNGLVADNIQFTDLNGSGIPGLLIEDRNAWYFKENMGDENYNSASVVGELKNPNLKFKHIKRLSQKPSLAHLSPQNAVNNRKQEYTASLLDIDGDNSLELMVFAPQIAGFYEREDEQWKNFKPFKQIPNIDMSDPNLRTIDVTGDGYADLLISQHDCFICYPSAEKNGWEKAFKTYKEYSSEKGPAVVFNDGEQSIYLADMTGDGLTDIVRITNTKVEYWANLGYAHFSEKITMENCPLFDNPMLFNQERIKLSDIDGSGTTDIIYISSTEVKYYINQSGNSFAQAEIIENFPKHHNLANVFVTDLFGNGTSCIVWSSPLKSDKPFHIKYIDLMSGTKPYLLAETNNNMGALSRFSYCPSTKFYLKHKREGRAWTTKLPFPVHVLERHEIFDKITGTRFVSLYEYHNGRFDGIEREFRGFGMVEQRDTENYESFADANLFEAGSNTDGKSHIPPVLTKTWFHNGTGNDFLNGIPWEYRREANRALAGSTLKQEIYAEDGSELENVAYQTTEFKYKAKLIQQQEFNKHAVFSVEPQETLTTNSERNPSDARTAHSMILQTDDFGNPTQTAEIVYPRQADTEFEEQKKLIITINEADFVHETENDNFYRHSVPIEQRQYHLTGLEVGANEKFSITDIKTNVSNANIISFEQKPNLTKVQKRELSVSKIFYYNEDASDALSFGEIASHVLPYRTLQKAYTTGLLDKIFQTKGETETLLPEAANLKKTLIEDGKFIELIEGSTELWQPSEIQKFNKNKFCVPVVTIDQFGNKTKINYDKYFIFPVSVIDAVGFKTESENNYRVLQPKKTTDPNGNIQEVEFDTLGMVVKTAMRGKNGEGDTLASPTTKLEYNFFNWKDNQKPNYVKTSARIEHKNPNTEWQHSWLYSNGLGKELMSKIQAEPGLANKLDENGELIQIYSEPRFIGSGRMIFDNKGNPVKQYEPYYSTTPEYEPETELTTYGVSPTLYYDPLGRQIKTLLPDGTFTKVEFTAWEQKNYDTNDTVLESEWYENIISQAGNVPTDEKEKNTFLAKQRAASLAAQHTETPQIIHLDTLGRAFLTIDDNGEMKVKTRLHLDLQENQLGVTDALGRKMTETIFDMLEQALYTTNIDSGKRWMLNNVVGNPILNFDSRNHQIETKYDKLHRPTEVWRTKKIDANTTKTKLLNFTVFGSDASKNNIHQPVRVFDSSGVAINTNFDFKGNVLTQAKMIAKEFRSEQDWAILLSKTTLADIDSAAKEFLESDTYTSAMNYDALNRPIFNTLPDNTKIAPQYDKTGQLKAVNANIKGNSTQTAFVEYINYNAKGQREAIKYANDTKTTYKYDEKNFRLTNLKTVKTGNTANPLQDIFYTYDPEGNITEIRDYAQPVNFYNNRQVEPVCKYEYDALYRLKKATGREQLGLNTAPTNTDVQINVLPAASDAAAMQNYTQLFEYDELGNILQMKSLGSWTHDYHYNNYENNNYLTGLSDKQNAYSYDAHGNMTRMPHLTSIGWDHLDQMTFAELGGGGKAYYVYDSGGNRTRKVVEKSGKLYDRIYIGTGYEIYRVHNSSIIELERDTIHIMDDRQRIAIVETKTGEQSLTRYQLDNHLGSSSIELDENANLISYEEYHPFGTTSYRAGRSAAEVSLKRYRYTGKEKDEETGLHYHGARYYAPWIGRWTSVDPLSEERIWLSPYNYVQNNPIIRVDPDGKLDGEFEKDQNGKWTKVSTKGDEIGVNFYHDDIVNSKGKKEQITYVTNGSRNWNIIRNGRNALKGEVRENDVTWKNIYEEWKNGYFPERSVFIGYNQANGHIRSNYLYKNAIAKFKKSGAKKMGGNIEFNAIDVILTGPNMQAQMMGSYNYSFYKLGNKTLALLQDSKSRTSFYYHLPVRNYKRGQKTESDGDGGVIFDDKESNTYQTYLFLD